MYDVMDKKCSLLSYFNEKFGITNWYDHDRNCYLDQVQEVMNFLKDLSSDKGSKNPVVSSIHESVSPNN